MYINERIYLPEGLVPEGMEGMSNASWFGVRVQWRGENSWAVVKGLGYPGHEFLSADSEWIFRPEGDEVQSCRFDYETACKLAEKIVETVTLNGMTYAELMKKGEEENE